MDPIGQCWQVHPEGAIPAEQTKLGSDVAGGRFEAFAEDTANNQYFITEDRSNGPVRRFRPLAEDIVPSGANQTEKWDMLNSEGTIDYLEFSNATHFQWTSSLSDGQASASTYYKNVEGITFHEGKIHFVSRRFKMIFILDLETKTYAVESTDIGELTGGGQFGDSPDQLLSVSSHLYFSEEVREDGGNPGVFVYNGREWKALLQAVPGGLYSNDGTVGLAFSPDGTFFIMAFQNKGHVYRIQRKDGLPFDGEGDQRLLQWSYNLGQ